MVIILVVLAMGSFSRQFFSKTISPVSAEISTAPFAEISGGFAALAVNAPELPQITNADIITINSFFIHISSTKTLFVQNMLFFPSLCRIAAKQEKLFSVTRKSDHSTETSSSSPFFLPIKLLT